MNELIINGLLFRGSKLDLQHVSLLVIQGNNGMLSCGYLSLEAAEKFGDALAIVTGVKNYDDMLNAEVKKVSTEAAKRGVCVGMSGKEALLLMA